MKKIILDLAVTLDGFIEGPNGEIDWCILDDDMELDDFLETVDTIFYGRVSYDAWGNFLPDDQAPVAEKRLWQAIHSKNKVVFSSQDRNDTRALFLSDDLAARVAGIKAKGGKDIWLYGGAGLIRTFIDLGLIDVYRLSVHPVVLGEGKPLFADVSSRLDLKLSATRTFRSGVVQLVYESR